MASILRRNYAPEKLFCQCTRFAPDQEPNLPRVLSVRVDGSERSVGAARASVIVLTEDYWLKLPVITRRDMERLVTGFLAHAPDRDAVSSPLR
jgi:hypothetical protein